MNAALIGIIVGGLGWLVLAGISTQCPIIAGATLILGIACYLISKKLFDSHPTRKFAIIGMSILWVIIINLVCLNLIHPEIPDQLWGISTGKDQLSLSVLNTGLGLLSLLGFGALYQDIKS